MLMKQVTSNDPMQKGYAYSLTDEPFDPEFTPDLTPKEMLQLGVFGGNYFDGHIDEYPKSWFKSVKQHAGQKDPNYNFFGVSASKPLSYWQTKGWIYHEDPRGWFQWYCRYYMGRRCPDDARQIKRWKAMRRHIGQLQKNCPKKALYCRPRQRQALLHWAYDSREL